MVPQETIDRIKRETKLVEFVRSRGVKLKKAGKEYRGLCPFHDDSEPSFFVSPVMNLWNCFACDVGGDVIKFVQVFDKVGFEEAVGLLAPMNGKVVREASNVKSETETAVPNRVALLERVFEFCHKTFLEDRRGLDYLKQRGITTAALFKTLRLGFANGSLLKTLSKDVKKQLKEIGILTSSDRERFRDCVVFPLVDLQGHIINLYGRHISKACPEQSRGNAHYYLPGELCGLFYPPKASDSLILTEGIIDALTLLNAGYRNVLPIYGVNGLTPDHLAFFQQQRIKQVTLCLDGDEQGRKAVPKLAKQLTDLGIEVTPVELPDGLDVNELFQKHSQEMFQELLSGAEEPLPKSPLEGGAALAAGGVSNVTDIEGGHLFDFGDRSYRVLGMNLHGLDRLKVNLKVQQQKAFHIDSFDLYASRAREQFVKTSARLLSVKESELVRELLTLIELLEQKRLELLQGGAKAPEQSEMTEAERKEALKFLKSKSLMKEILADFDRTGCIGEETAKLFGYLATISRFLEKPLGILIVSRSGAGKSLLQDAICNFVPPEDLQSYTRITGQSLFYKQGDELKYKVLAIAEEKGAEDAIYSIRTLQSDQHLTVAVTITDPKSGQKRTEEYQVEGPVVILITTTNPEALDFETRNRFVILTIDESREQTRRILQRQRERDSLEGLVRSQSEQHILRKHHNAQRLLRHVHVVNPFHKELTYPDDKLLMRRDHQKYLTLIKTIAFLHQYQREVKTIATTDGEKLEYIEVTVKDIEIANKLACEILGRSLDELSPHTRSLLEEIKQMVETLSKPCKTAGQAAHKKLDEIRLTRREICEATGWSYWQVRPHLEQLVQMEYLYLHSGRQGKRHSYELLWQGEGGSGERFLIGLSDVAQLKKAGRS